MLTRLAGSILPGDMQVTGGTFTGMVRDSSGAVVPAASIGIRAINTGVQTRLTTNSEGIFLATFLPAGDYLLTAEKEGFNKEEFGPVALQVNQTVRVDFNVLSTDTEVGIDEFRDLVNFPLDEMLHYGDGDALVPCTTNEQDPGAARVAEAPIWTYTPPKLTQYWRVPAHDIQPDLRTKVNVRRTYWASRVALPRGAAFENFEVRQRYVPGQTFVFGLTPNSPDSFRPRVSGLPKIH
jgi:hypothetical protein